MEVVLIVDDDAEIRALVRKYLEREHYTVLETSTLKTALSLLQNNPVQLVLLDVFLPDGNGISFCSEIRKFSNVPILLISAKGDDSDVVLGLGVGADDFITKPFSLNQLIARVKAQLRRASFLQQAGTVTSREDAPLISGDIYIEQKKRIILCRGKAIDLTAKEFDLLAYLVRNEGIVFHKEQLYEAIWGYDAVGDCRTVAVHVKNIREKIEKDSRVPKMLVMVWGVGYKFVKG